MFLSSFTGSYLVSLGFTWCLLVFFLGMTRFDCYLIRFYWVLPSNIGFLGGFQGFIAIFLGFTFTRLGKLVFIDCFPRY